MQHKKFVTYMINASTEIVEIFKKSNMKKKSLASNLMINIFLVLSIFA